MCQLFLKKGCLAKYWQKTGQIAGVKCLAVDLGRGFDHSGKTVAKNRKLPPTARPAGKVSVSTTTARRIPVRRHFPTWLAAAGLVLMALAVYWPGMQGGFISFDDPDNVTQNILLRTTGGLGQIWALPCTTQQYYPLFYTSFWLEYHLWGLNPAGYHVLNVLLHALAAILLWRVLMRLQIPGAWLGAALFAVHPMMVESVAWVTEQKNVLSTVFYFAAALAYWRWAGPPAAGDPPDDQQHPPRHWYFIALGLFLAALLSKTVTCSLPAALLLVIWWQRGRLVRGDFWPLLPFFAVGLWLSGVTARIEHTQVGAVGPEWAYSFADRCLIAGRALWFYAGKLGWPVNLTFIYPRWEINAWVWWQWLFPAAALVLVVTLWGLRRRIGRGPLVAVLFFAGTLLPVLGFSNYYFMRYSFVADHFQYLAGLGLLVPAAAGLVKLLRPIPWAAVVLPASLAMLTWQQARLYANEETLWQDTLAKNPGCWLAHNSLGEALLKQGRLQEAMEHWKLSVKLKPDEALPHNNLGSAFNQLGQTDAAINEFETALQDRPDYAIGHYNLACALAQAGRTDEATRQFQSAINLEPDRPEFHKQFGLTLAKNNQTAAAIRQFEAAIRLQPDDVDTHFYLGNALLKQGQADEAGGEFQAALRLEPDNAETHNNLGNALLLLGRTDAAIREFQTATRDKPDYSDAHYNLGVTLLNQGQLEEAIRELQGTIRLLPNFAEAHINLGIALAEENRLYEAISQFRTALRFKPDDAAAQQNLEKALALKSHAGGK